MKNCKLKAVVLAAGKGKRLYPLTLERSKAMLPILGKPMIERVMESLIANGILEFIIVVNPEDDDIQKHLLKIKNRGAEVRFVYQQERLGMAHALMQAAPYIDSQFILTSCDNLLADHDIIRLVNSLCSTSEPNGVLTLLKVPREKISSISSVMMKDGQIQYIVEKPDPEEAPSDMASIAVYGFSKALLDFLPLVSLSKRGEYELQEAIQMLIDSLGNVVGMEIDKRFTLTNPKDLLQINEVYLASMRPELNVFSAEIDPTVQFLPPARIEQGVVIGKNSVVGPCVYLEEGCRVGEGVNISNSIVLRNRIVQDGDVIREKVVG